MGVLGGPDPEVAATISRIREGGPERPDSVEVRADLFDGPERAIEALRALPAGLPAIFTVRLEGRGGRFEGPETRRVRWCLEALGLGAALVDLEWDTDAARELAGLGAPLVASHHDFDAMPEDSTIEGLTAEMSALGPRAIKLVPTAVRPADSVRMLRWVADAASSPGVPRRVGFAMGPAGIPSRVLALAWGGAWTYGALGASVAPGIPSVVELQVRYRSRRLSRASRVLGVVGPAASRSGTVTALNRALAARGLDAVCLPFETDDPAGVLPLIDALPIAALRIEPKLREPALLLAGEVDRTARAARAADALVVDRSGERLAIRAFHREPVGSADSAEIAGAFDLLCHLLGDEPTRGALEEFLEDARRSR